eukprot:711276-Lingulodinium_polyedra.AAC.1
MPGLPHAPKILGNGGGWYRRISVRLQDALDSTNLLPTGGERAPPRSISHTPTTHAKDRAAASLKRAM